MLSPSRFLIRGHWGYWWDDAKLLFCFTDAPVHLRLLWNAIGIIPHHRIIMKRGFPYTRDVHLSLKPVQEIDQNEPDDTEYHTFWAPNWLQYKKITYYFKGTVAGEETLSRSPFFDAIPPELGVPPIFEEPWTWLGEEQPAWKLTHEEQWTWLGEDQPPWAWLFSEHWEPE